MIGLDTNVVVRYLTQDDPVQSARATELIERGFTELEPGFVSLVALVETVWVLQRAYRYSRADVFEELERLLKFNSLVIEHEDEVAVAWMSLTEENGEFADALIAALGARAGCSHTLTFDRRALRLPGFQVA